MFARRSWHHNTGEAKNAGPNQQRLERASTTRGTVCRNRWIRLPADRTNGLSAHHTLMATLDERSSRRVCVAGAATSCVDPFNDAFKRGMPMQKPRSLLR